MQPQPTSILDRLLQASALVVIMISLLFWSSAAALAVTAPKPSNLMPPTMSSNIAGSTGHIQASSDLTTTLDQFLQEIPRGFYGVRNINQLKTWLKETDLVLIDVREASEYEDGHIDGAINIPLRHLVQNLGQVPQDKPVMLYCSSGYRTGMGVMTLRLLGYNNIEGFPPSYQGWIQDR